MISGRRAFVIGSLAAMVLAGGLAALGWVEESPRREGRAEPAGMTLKPSPSATVATRERRTFAGKLKQIGANSFSRLRRAVNRIL